MTPGNRLPTNSDFGDPSVNQDHGYISVLGLHYYKWPELVGPQCKVGTPMRQKLPNIGHAVDRHILRKALSGSRSVIKAAELMVPVVIKNVKPGICFREVCQDECSMERSSTLAACNQINRPLGRRCILLPFRSGVPGWIFRPQPFGVSCNTE